MSSIWQHKRQKPEIMSVEVVAKTALFEVQAVDLRFSNGQERQFERLAPSATQAVMILPVIDNYLIMIREYAVGTERYELTFPKGRIDYGETPEVAANRELQEEIGFAAGKLMSMRMLYTSPSHMYGPMHVYVAEDLYSSRLDGDEPEPLELVYVPIKEIDDLIALSEFGDARTLAALMLWQRFYFKNNE